MASRKSSWWSPDERITTTIEWLDLIRFFLTVVAYYSRSIWFRNASTQVSMIFSIEEVEKLVQNVPYTEMNNMQKTSDLPIMCIEVDVSLTQQHACIIAGCIVHWKVPNLMMPFQLIYNYKTGHKWTFDVAPTQSRSVSIIQANRGPSWLPLIHIKLISVDLNTKWLSESSVIQWAMRARKPALLLANQVSAVNEIQLRAF